MEKLKEFLKEEKERLTRLKNDKCLEDTGYGKLRLIDEIENLILFGVGCSKQIKEETDFIVYKGKKYVHKTDLETLIDNGTYVEVS